MALGALIMASEDTGEGGERLRATLPLLGRTLVEHQVRQALAAGASHAVLLVERIPAALTEAVDRLRRDGLRIDVTRTIADAADRFHPDERLLLIADGCVADVALLQAQAAAPPPAVAALADRLETATFERIDADARWAGVATIDGAALRRTAAMLGDWDAQSTLLRAAVQAGAARIDAGNIGRARIVAGAADLDGIDRRLIGESGGGGLRWPRRWLFAAVDGPLAQWLARRSVDPLPVAATSAACAILGAGAALAGWGWSGLVLGLVSGPVAAVAWRLARVRLSTIRHGATIDRLRQAGLAGMLLGLSLLAGSWGWTLAAGVAIAAMLALAAASRGLAALSGDRGPIWIADGDGMAWAMLAGILAGGWGTGIALATGYAAASFAVIQRRLVAVAERHDAV